MEDFIAQLQKVKGVSQEDTFDSGNGVVPMEAFKGAAADEAKRARAQYQRKNRAISFMKRYTQNREPADVARQMDILQASLIDVLEENTGTEPEFVQRLLQFEITATDVMEVIPNRFRFKD